MKLGIMGNQKGAYAVIFTLILLVLLGFVALGIEAGRWYLVRAELSKSVDAAALAGANSISSPIADQLAEDFGRENFYASYLGTPGLGTAGDVQFQAARIGINRIGVTGNVNATPILAQLFGVTTIPVQAFGIAQKNKVEIMMVLDRSGSMGNPISKMNALKQAAVGNCSNPQTRGFVCYFEDTQNEDRIGLVSFASTARVDLALGYDFVDPITTAAIAMSPIGATNMAQALSLAGGPQGLPDQSGLPANQRLQQFVVFFTDGRPTAFQGSFRYRGNTFEAVATVPGNCPIPPSASYPNVYPNLYSATAEGVAVSSPSHPYPAGSGDTTQMCRSSLQGNNLFLTTMWNRFTIVPPTTPYTIGQCVNDGVLGRYVCEEAREMAFVSAQALKNRGVMIYTIGLQPDADADFLKRLSSDCPNWQNSWPACNANSGFSYIAPTPAELQAIFNIIARDIKLRLVQ
jgi:Flp pilus assembly protein TadG